MALSRDIVIKLLGDAKSAVDAQKAAADAAGVAVGAYKRAERAWDQQQKAMDAAAAKQKRAMQEVGTAAAGLGVAMVAGLGVAVKAAADWESAWAGVTKTVSGTPQQLAKVEEGLRGLARTMPSTHDEIAAVAEAAGQLGVQTDSIVDFTKTMIDLGQTTNLTADEAATALAQLMNVMGTAPQDVDRLGASLVALGNDGASTEADIVKMASYITGSAKLIGASESDVLALANTMTSLGINAERGGGVMTRVMQDIYSAVQMGGAQLDNFAKVAGMSSAEFARAFQADPIRAIGAFTDGLGAAKARGDNVVEMLGGLGYIGTQDTAVLLQLSGAQGQLNDNLDLGNQAWQQNTALVQEAAKRYDTTASKVAIAKNNLNDAAIEIGDVLLPVLASMAETVADVAGWFADLPGPVKEVLTVLGSIVGVTALVGGGFLLLAPRVMASVAAFQALSASGGRAAGAMRGIGKAAGVAASLAILGAAVRGLDDAMAPAEQSMEQYTKTLLDMDGSIGSLDKKFSSLDQGLSSDITGFADAIKRVTDPSNVERLNDFGGALFNAVTFGGSGTGEGAASRRRVLEEIGGIDQALALMVQNGNAEMAAQQFELMTAEAKKNGVSVTELKELFPGYESALQGIANEQEMAATSAQSQAESSALLAQNLDAAYGSIEGYAAALGMDEDATNDLIKKTEELGQSLADFIDPLGAYTSMLDEKKAAEEDAARKAAEAAGAGSDAWKQFVVDTGFSFDEYMRRLEEQVQAQTNWQENMLRLAGRVSQGTLDELKRMGPEGAPLVADLVNRSDAELDRFDDVTARRSKEATDAMAAQLTMAAPVLAAVGAKAGQGVVDELAAKLQAGTITVAQIAAQYGVGLASGINPILTGLGKRPIAGVGGRLGGLVEADGGIVSYYANGGVENHVAQIAPAGAWRVWAEPETGGEAYIPLSQSKRGRSMDIWRQTGKMLGAPEAQFYASGGFATSSDVPRPPSTAPFQPPISTPADAAMQKAYDEVTSWLNANAAPMMAGPSGPVGAGVERWRSLVLQALGLVGQPAGYADITLRRMNQESGGNARAINNWDINAKRGTPSKGLMQVIDPTFRAYAMPGYNSNIWDPMSNVLASMRYALRRYGSLPAAYNKSGGYDEGGIANGMGFMSKGTVRPERVLSPRQTEAFEDWMRRPAGAMPVLAPKITIAPTPVSLTLEGAAITGRLEMGTDGIATLVDGQIANAIVTGGAVAGFGRR